jgi:hypothetical protein
MLFCLVLRCDYVPSVAQDRYSNSTSRLTLRKLLELRLNIRSASLTIAFRRVVVPALLVVDVVAAPLM